MLPRVHIGSLQLGTYGLMIGLGVVVFVAVSALRARRGRPPLKFSLIMDISFNVILPALAGAWLTSAIPAVANALAAGEPLPERWWLGRGMNWFGAVAFGSLAGYLYCQRHKLPWGLYFDIFAPALPLLLAVVRVGCLCAGCCYGLETTAWFAVVLPGRDGVWASRYPTQFVDMAANLLIAAALLLFERYARRRGGDHLWPFDGFLFLAYIELYCIQRFLFEFWRADLPVFFGPFHWLHLYCALGITLNTYLIVRKLTHKGSKYLAGP